VIGENRTLAEISTLTQIAQTTLSTYVRIAKLFLNVRVKALAPFYTINVTGKCVGGIREGEAN
jgi:hypothetical protein